MATKKTNLQCGYYTRNQSTTCWQRFEEFQNYNPFPPLATSLFGGFLYFFNFFLEFLQNQTIILIHDSGYYLELSQMMPKIDDMGLNPC